MRSRTDARLTRRQTPIADKINRSLELFRRTGLALVATRRSTRDGFRDPGQILQKLVERRGQGRNRRTGSSAGCTFATRRIASDRSRPRNIHSSRFCGISPATKPSREIYDSPNYQESVAPLAADRCDAVFRRRWPRPPTRTSPTGSSSSTAPRPRPRPRRPRSCAAPICPRPRFGVGHEPRAHHRAGFAGAQGQPPAVARRSRAARARHRGQRSERRIRRTRPHHAHDAHARTTRATTSSGTTSRPPAASTRRRPGTSPRARASSSR